MKKNIFLIDDDPIIRKVIGLTLEKAGFYLKKAENGIIALEILEKNLFNPDIILLDIRMPKI